MKRRRRRRTHKKNRVNFFKWFRQLHWGMKTLLISAAVLLILTITVWIILACTHNKMNFEKIAENDILVNELDESVGKGYTNIALFGGDSRTGELEKYINTDTMIIVSINNKTKEVKLVSLYRDTILDIGGGLLRKSNAAYCNGGAAQGMSMLNVNLDMTIKQFITVDFRAVTELVDLVGGIEVELTEQERREVNRYLDETARVTGKPATKLYSAGLQTLNGVQATTYSRIRKNVGNDYARTQRQRDVIQKVVEKAMKSDVNTIRKIVNTVFPKISTNIPLSTMLDYALSLSKYKIVSNTGFPFENEFGNGTVAGQTYSIYPNTLEENVSMLHEFLYGTKDYKPSLNVQSVSAKIMAAVNGSWGTSSGSGSGNTLPQPQETEQPEKPKKEVEPSKKEEPEKPEKPVKPEKPEKPTDPVVPNNPETPTEPTDQNNPGTPTEPVDPNNPGTPTEPADPNIPGTSTEPSEPEQPTEPSEPNESGQSGV